MTKRAPIREPEPKKPPHQEPPNTPPSRKEPPTNEPPREEPDDSGAPMKVGRGHGDGAQLRISGRRTPFSMHLVPWGISTEDRLRMDVQTQSKRSVSVPPSTHQLLEWTGVEFEEVEKITIEADGQIVIVLNLAGMTEPNLVGDLPKMSDAPSWTFGLLGYCILLVRSLESLLHFV